VFLKRAVQIALLSVGLLSNSLFAQVDTGVVSGSVKDSSGAIIPNAAVTLLNIDTGVTFDTRSDGSGEYQFPVVPVGSYKVAVEQAGFSPLTSAVVRIDVGSRQRIDATMQISGSSQSVTVNATESVAVVESDSSDRGQVVQAREVINLPLNGRNYSDLALLAPGVNRSGLENSNSDTSREGSFNVNGVRSTLNNFLLDGLDNNSYSFDNNTYSNQSVQVSPDALAEFKIETDNFAAEYGRAGGGIINAATHSGTAQLHGVIWEYLRNTYFDAKGAFTVAPSATVPNPTPSLIQNQFGGAIGGKIIPKKLFFFADYEGFRRAFHNLQTSTLPTARQRAGTFTTTDDATGTAVSVRNPYTGVVYAGQLPAAAFTVNPLASLVLNALPLPNLPGFSSNYSVFPGGTVQTDKGDGRLDYFLNDRLNFFGRYSQLNTLINDPPPIPGPAGGYSKGVITITSKQFAVGANVVVNNRSTADVRFAYTPLNSNTVPPGFGQPSLLVQAGIPNVPTDPSAAGSLNSQQPTGFSKLGRDPSVPTTVNPSTYNGVANYSLLLGKHSVKAGFSEIAINTQIQNFHPQYGTDTYKGLFSTPTGAKAPAGTAGTATKEDWSITDFIYGARDTYELSNNPVANYREQIYGFYAQDDWRAANSVVINAGVRYEIATPQYEANNHLSNYNPVTNSLVVATPGSIYNRSLQNLNLTNVAPRLGVAFTPYTKTAIRSAYGISYIQFNRTNSVGELASNAPFVADSLITQAAPVATGGMALCAVAATNCFNPTQLGYPTNFIATGSYNPLINQAIYRPAHSPTGYVQSYQLSVQQELPANIIVDLAYVGNHGVHEVLEADYNQAVPNAPGGALSLQARRPITTNAGIQEVFDGGTSNYNAFQAKVEHRSNNGLYLLNSFTYGRAFDQSAGPSENIGNSDSTYVNIRNLNGDYARSSFDVPILETFSVVWDLPYGPGQRFGSNAGTLAREVLGGWTLTTITSHTSGTPINLIYTASGTQSVSSLISYRPNLNGKAVLANTTRTSNALQLLDPTVVAIPPVNTPFGNASRNAARGKAFNTSDVGVHKKFFISSDGKRNFELRAEAFNVFNHVNYGLPDSNVSDAAYGQVTTTLPARQLQFAGRLTF
jgi:hypothetical protein